MIKQAVTNGLRINYEILGQDFLKNQSKVSLKKYWVAAFRANSLAVYQPWN